MKTGDTKCFGCNQGYLNCYQTCPDSPSHGNDISLTPIQTSNLEQCDNGYRREMHIKADAIKEYLAKVLEKKDTASHYAPGAEVVTVEVLEHYARQFTEGSGESGGISD